MDSSQFKKLLLSFLLFFTLFTARPVYAQTSDEVICVGEGLAEYANSVLSQLGSLQHVKLLTPAFNLTNQHFALLANTFASNIDLNQFDGIAGNAYNLETPEGIKTISEYVTGVRNTALGWRPLMLTEIGWYPHDVEHGPTQERLDLLRQEIRKFPGIGVTGGLIFDVFRTNTDSRYAGQEMDSSQIQYVCDNDCYNARVGANSASFYLTDGFYRSACNEYMKFTLEIANADDPRVLEGILRAHNCTNGVMYPVVRLGVMDSGGGFEDANKLVELINQIEANVNHDVYVIIGPNEPLTEHWATPDCDVSSDDAVTLTDWSPVRSAREITNTNEISGTGPAPPQPLGVSTGKAPGDQSQVLGDISWKDWFLTLGFIDGQAWLERIGFPDFETTQHRNTGALKWLLTPDQNDELELPGKIKIDFIIRVLNMWPPTGGDLTECEDSPKGYADVKADLWPKLVGSTYISKYGLAEPWRYGEFTNPKVDLPSAGETCDTFSHGPGPLVSSQDIPASFSVTSWSLGETNVARRIGTGLIGGILGWFQQFQERVKPLANGLLAGVPSSVESSRQMHSFMAPQTAEILGHEGESGTLDSATDFAASFSPADEEVTEMLYSRTNPTRANHCISLCELLTPEETERVNEIDPLCTDEDGNPSCDPRDYAVTREEPCTAPWELDPGDPGYSPKPPGCHWDKWLCACHYYSCELGEPGCERGCADDQDPLCEGGLCNWDALQIPKDACTASDVFCENKACMTVPAGCNPCTENCQITGTKCSAETFEPNDKISPDASGIVPYGPCFFANPTVCMAGGFNGGLDDCNNVCNWQCCN